MFLHTLDTTRSGILGAKVEGLIGNHAYSVLRAVECNGKRFVVVRNPWGKSEWTGRWSDGSKEWTQEWLEHLSTLGHQFGDDGQFVMEYSDWLECFGQIDRTILFDSNWMMSSQWLHVTTQPLPAPWSHGDVSFTFSLSGPSSTVIVLSQLDSRYFRDVAGQASWSLDFTLVKEGEKEPIAESAHSEFYLRSVYLETELEAGNYIVYVRLDRTLDRNEDKKTVEIWQSRKLSRILSERAKSQSIASNFKSEARAKYLATPLDELIQRDVEEYEKKRSGEPVVIEEEVNESDNIFTTTTTTTTTTTIEKVVVRGNASSVVTVDESGPVVDVPTETTTTTTTSTSGTATPAAPDPNVPDTVVEQQRSPKNKGREGEEKSDDDKEEMKGKILVDHDDPNSVCIGLRVYTHKDVPAVIVGRLKTPAVSSTTPAVAVVPPTSSI